MFIQWCADGAVGLEDDIELGGGLLRTVDSNVNSRVLYGGSEYYMLRRDGLDRTTAGSRHFERVLRYYRHLNDLLPNFTIRLGVTLPKFYHAFFEMQELIRIGIENGGVETILLDTKLKDLENICTSVGVPVLADGSHLPGFSSLVDLA